MNDKLIDPPAAVSARRRLIRGAFATPAVLTICSGSALAASSAAVRAIANQVNTQATFPNSGQSAPYLRVSCYDGGGKKWVRGQDLPQGIVAKGKSVYLTSAQYQNLTDSGFPITSSPPTLTINANFAAVRVDASGNVIGVVQSSGNTGSAVTNSVWTSFSLSL